MLSRSAFFSFQFQYWAKKFWKSSNHILWFSGGVRQGWFSTLLYPVSLLIGYWDWVQGGNPLYPAVKCLSSCWGQIWRIFFISFAKRTWHIQFLAAKFFSGSKKNFIPPKLAIFWGFRHFPKIEGPFPKFTSFDNLFFTQESVWKPSVILLLCLSHLWKLLVPLSWPFFQYLQQQW